MTYVVSLKRTAEKELEGLPTKIHDRIVKHLDSLKDNPRPAGSKKLRGREGYRTRIGVYRILYAVDDSEKKVEIFAIGHRKKVYRNV